MSGSAPVETQRETRVTIDVVKSYVVERAFMHSRMHQEMSRGTTAKKVNVEHVTGYGWRLKPYHAHPGALSSRSDAQGSIMTTTSGPALLRVPTKTKSFNKSRPSPLLGASTGADAQYISAAADPFNATSFTAGDDVSGVTYRLSDLDTAYGESAVPHSRTYSAAAMKTDIATVNSFDWRKRASWSARFSVPSPQGTALLTIARIFKFPGPAGVSYNFAGVGQYTLDLLTDGSAWLFETGYSIVNGSIIGGKIGFLRRVFRWRSERSGPGAYRIFVTCFQSQTSNGGGAAGIEFRFEHGTQQKFSVFAAGTGSDDHDISRFIYPVPNNPPPTASFVSPAEVPMPLQGLKPQGYYGEIQLATDQFPTSGYFEDDPFVIPEIVNDQATYLNVAIDAYIPTGTQLRTRLFNAKTGAECTAISYDGLGKGQFQLQKGVNAYYFKFEYTGTADLSPVLRSWSCKRMPVMTTSRGTPATLNPASISVTGQEFDLTQETCTLDVPDPRGTFDILQTRVGMAAKVTTSYEASPSIDWTNPANDAKRATLIEGYVTSAPAKVRTQGKKHGLGAGGGTIYSPSAGYPLIIPNQSWARYERLEIMGEWTRIEKAVLPHRVNFTFDPDASRDPQTGLTPPWKATDALVELFRICGYPDSEIDITASDVRLFATPDDNWYLSPLTPIAPLMMRIARDYLGAFICRDNTRAAGRWRVIPQVRPATSSPHYKNVIHFKTDPVATGKGLVHVRALYGTDVEGARNVPVSYIIDTLEKQAFEPEANLIVATMSGNLSDTNTTLVVVNPFSFDFYGSATADPTSSDYLPYIKPMAILDRTIRDRRALRWMIRRAYDFCAHGYKARRFIAPATLVFPTDDVSATRPRLPRYLDPVTVDGVQYLVRDVNLIAKKDNVHLAVFDVETPTGPYAAS